MKIPIDLIYPNTNEKLQYDNKNKNYYCDTLSFTNFDGIPNLFLADDHPLSKIQS